MSLLSALTREYLTANKISAALFEFSHPDALLSSCESVRFHLYILDIVMPMVDGISLGKELRRLDREAQIIYATTEPQFALQAFAANPINFLIKPVNQEAFFSTLNLALSKIEAEDEVITVKTKAGIFVVPISNILCCEYIARGVTYQLASGEKLHGLSSARSFSAQIATLLNRRDFIQPHISFAVNLHHVEALTRQELLLRGGVSLPVSKKQYPLLRDRYLDFRLAKEWKKQ